MATLRQMRANQANAQKSTGPRSDEGKARSRANALDHGLSGDGPVCEAHFREQVEHYKQMFRRYFPTRNVAEEEVYEQYCVSLIRMKACQFEQARLRAAEARRARDCWDDDHETQVDRIAARIRRDPGPTMRLLRTSLHGRLWLIAQWEALRLELDQSDWTPDQEKTAHDLMGHHPDFRAAKPWRDDPRAFVAEQIESLSASLANYKALDQYEYQHAIEGVPIHPSRRMERLIREESACIRRQDQLLRILARNPACLFSPQFAGPFQDDSLAQKEAREAEARRAEPAPQPAPEPAAATPQPVERKTSAARHPGRHLNRRQRRERARRQGEREKRLAQRKPDRVGSGV